ncbi:aromatic ring-hydroxylating dioxygenase subunit alpha [Pseudomonas mohnii]|jgi:phenylpropionate dioxygenase-like ring-hydroxylating dioxygenase large terminal subunit
MFLRNAWYVIVEESELGEGLYPSTILGEKVVLFRKADGTPVALEDACPHRKLPLSMGRKQGDHIECGYHGLTFDCSGSCVRAPGSSRIPQGAKVRSYPLAVRYGLIWIWMGDLELADPEKIFQVKEWGDPEWGINRGGTMTVECNYLYMTDNLLDPAHVAWVHQTSFGNSACENEPLKTDISDFGVTVSRWMRDVEVAPFYAKFVKFSGRCDRKQHYEVHYPSHAVIKSLFTPAGTGSDEGPLHDQVFLMSSYNFLTPIDESNTRYFWFQMRNFDQNSEEVSRQFDEDVRFAFSEDRVILTAVHQGMANKCTPNIDLASDSGPLRFRRNLDKLIAQEQPDNLIPLTQRHVAEQKTEA